MNFKERGSLLRGRFLVFLFFILIISSIKVNASFDNLIFNTSMLGHLKNETVQIYKTLGNYYTAFTLPETYNKKVLYIKKEAKVNGETYYLLSTRPSSEKGVIGWVRSNDVDTRNHVGVDMKSKTLYVNGIGHAYSKAWGGTTDIVYNDLSKYRNYVFKVDKTEKVGNNIWYRGILDGKRVFLHSNWVGTKKESITSRLGHIKSDKVKIFKVIGDSETSFTVSTNFMDTVLYIKKEAKVNGEIYYLLSTRPSSEKGVIGWVRSNDVDTRNHVGVDMKSKTLYVKGIGHAYSKAWGGTTDIVYNDLSKYRNYVFKVDKTEKVGNNIWYRGILDGKRVFLHSNWVGTKKESVTSRLGHIKSDKVKIFKVIGDPETSFTVGTNIMDTVLYIKKEAKVNGEIYYLLSTRPSSEKGVIGWVRSNDVDTRNHVGVDMKSKTLYVNGIGHAYSKAWGGTTDIVYNDLSKYRNYVFKVDKTEKVGSNIWYRGILDGKRVFLHSNWVGTKKESITSRLGHIKSDKVKIFKVIGDPETSFTVSTNFMDTVLYIKKEAKVNGETYYLLSTQPSSEKGVIGWISSTNVDSMSHIGVDSKNKLLTIKGNGLTYSKAWGGLKDVVHPDLSKFQNSIFKVNKTEKVGNNIWYRGELDGKIVFIQSIYVVDKSEKYTEYNVTFADALNMQMNVNPQTDKYRDYPAYISSQYVDIYSGGYISGNGVNLRTSPRLDTEGNNIHITVDNGTPFLILDTNIIGDEYAGSYIWYKIEYQNQILYVHSSLAKINSKVGKVTGNNVRIRADKSINSHIYDKVNSGTLLTILEEGTDWHKIDYKVWRNATRSDVEYYLNPLNFKNDSYQKFQFLDLTKPSGASVVQLNNFLKGKGVLEGKGQAFIDASNKYGINDVYLISHALLETGNGTSPLSQGVMYNGKKVYNVYGIGAYDGSAEESGAKKAFDEGWFSLEDAIIGGAQFIENNYIKNGQNTLYKMRWNPAGMEENGYAIHQYATDIGWAYKQVGTLYNLYQKIGITNLILDIPVYN